MIVVNATLRSYLGHVLETEKNLHILNYSAYRMQQQIDSLGISQNIVTPEKQSAIVEAADWDDGEGVSVYKTLFWLGVCIGMIGVPIYTFITDDSFILWRLLNTFFGLLLGFPIGAVIGIVIAIIVFVAKFLFSKAVFNSDYEAATVHHRNALIEDEDRVMHELKVKENALLYRNDIVKNYHETKKVLDELYSVNIVHEQYRNIAAIAIIYQYIDTGICSELKGANGAYALLREDKWWGTVAGKLDVIADKLDMIHTSQFVLLNAFQSANDKLTRIANMHQMSLLYTAATAENSEIIAYNTSVIKQNTDITAWIKILNM